jgi:alanine dehydrogenase
MEKTDLLISAHYWDPLSPKIFKLENLHKFNTLKVIGDITCDINGSIPTTLKSTSIKDPYFYFDKSTNSEINKTNDAIAIMAVDNLPSELPRDSSEEFGNGIVEEILPYIIKKDDQRIHDATICKNGNFLPKYLYLENYISK